MVVFLRFIMLTKGLVAAVIWMVTGVLERCRWGLLQCLEVPVRFEVLLRCLEWFLGSCRDIAPVFGAVARVFSV